MGRKRSRDFDLPPRLHRRGDRFYYVTHERRWIPLGNELAVARRKWADLECLGVGNTVRELVWGYYDAVVHVAETPASTVKQYKSFANVIDAEWGTLPGDRLTRVQIARWRDSGVARSTANGVISLLRVSYRWAMERNENLINPAVDVAFNAMDVRMRYITDDEFRAIWNAAPRWMRTAMDLSYLTALRPSDVLALRWDDVGGDRLSSRTRKTGVRLAFVVTPEVSAVLEDARERPILGLYVVANDKGRPMKIGRWQEAMKAICAKLGIEDATPRDLRAKAATDAADEGLDYQALLGHSSKRMSDRYLKLKRTRLAPTLSRNIR
jgi:integrase